MYNILYICIIYSPMPSILLAILSVPTASTNPAYTIWVCLKMGFITPFYISKYSSLSSMLMYFNKGTKEKMMFKTCQKHRFSSIPRLAGDGFEGVTRPFSHGNNGVMRFVVNVVIKKDVLHIIVQWDPQRCPWLRDVLHLLPMVVVVPNRNDGFG